MPEKKEESRVGGGTVVVHTPEPKPPKSGLCGHKNQHYKAPGDAPTPLLCTKPYGHEGDHFALADAKGNEVINGFWSDAAG